ncbi:class I SAM-dependent methyltransferase [Candidatus Gottesmanbacteria bacterium]|nr:class I SAM-dependent methyltransferase [Candidatus Gottesmanbacteria bacterium]
MITKYTRFNSIPFEGHMLVLGKIEEGSKVLDVGCATGYFAQKLKEKKCRVWGVEIDRKAAKIARKYCEEVMVGDVESFAALHHPRSPWGHLGGATSLKKNFFDYILLMDILEHLKNPGKLLVTLKPYLKKKGKIIICVPNVAFFSVRLNILLGKFNYEQYGILDESHLHFFTKQTFLRLVQDSGLKLLDFDVVSGFSQITLIGRLLDFIPKYLQYKISKLWDTLLGYQFIAIITDSSTSGKS